MATPCFFAGVEDFFHIVIEGFAAQDEAAGGMGDDLGVGIFDGGEEAVGHFRAARFM